MSSKYGFRLYKYLNIEIDINVSIILILIETINEK